MEPDEVFATVLAGLCHDADHPGVGNGFLVATGHPLAVRANDQAVLEQWHAFATWRVLRRADCRGMLDGLDVAAFRKTTIAGILATDMARHGAVVAGVVGLKDEGPRDGKRVQTLVEGLVHGADVSNPAKPWPLSKKWSDLVTVEFYAQGDRERARGLPISFGMDRATASQKGTAIGFGSKLVGPFYRAIADLSADVAPVVAMLDENVETWRGMDAAPPPPPAAAAPAAAPSRAEGT